MLQLKRQRRKPGGKIKVSLIIPSVLFLVSVNIGLVHSCTTKISYKKVLVCIRDNLCVNMTYTKIARDCTSTKQYYCTSGKALVRSLVKFQSDDVYELTSPLYRYYHAGISDHFYTTNYKELGSGRNGWRYEGVQCKILKYAQSGSVPLYRYWNGRDHFYTTNIAEIGTSVHGVTGRHGYKSEGVTGYCYPNRRRGTIPLRRYYRHSIDHFYTTNINEIGTRTSGKIGRHGYKYEGVACFVFPK